MKPDDAKLLKELAKENHCLKRIVADQAIDIDMLKGACRNAQAIVDGSWGSPGGQQAGDTICPTAYPRSKP